MTGIVGTGLRCPRPHCGGTLVADERHYVCLLCGRRFPMPLIDGLARAILARQQAGATHARR